MRRRKEIWKDINQYEGLYNVSNTGFIRRLRKDGSVKKLLKPYPTRDGYFLVGLHKNHKHHRITVHSLVVKHFLPNPNNLKEVNHKDGDKSNNAVWNLEWSTRSKNLLHAFRVLGIKTTAIKISAIKDDKSQLFNSLTEASATLKIDNGSISKVLKGTRYTAGGYVFKHV